MNKLFIVGNGFDLAHGLPTSYSHFLNDFWSNLSLKYFSSWIYQNLVFINPKYEGIFNFGKIKSFEDFLINLNEYNKEYPTTHIETKECIFYADKSKKEIIFKFNNDFFKKLNKSKSTKKWVDIECDYYVNLRNLISISNKKNIHEIDKLVEVLNKEFENIRQAFEYYLETSVDSNYNFNEFEKGSDWIETNNIFKSISVYHNNTENIHKEFIDEEDKQHITELLNSESFNNQLNHSCFLNFNYTKTLNIYYKKNNTGKDIVFMNHIHGELNSNDNLINFGYGDEMDEEYKKIENFNNNEYLKYFKSFKYSQNNNYSNLLSFLNFNKFQVIILGHSCGLSDRTLLNTIFEHENCRSIKVYYYQIEEKDNYTEIVQNISRHFNDKKLMRRRIVSKNLCSPLPQNARLKKIR